MSPAASKWESVARLYHSCRRSRLHFGHLDLKEPVLLIGGPPEAWRGAGLHDPCATVASAMLHYISALAGRLSKRPLARKLSCVQPSAPYFQGLHPIRANDAITDRKRTCAASGPVTLVASQTFQRTRTSWQSRTIIKRESKENCREKRVSTKSSNAAVLAREWIMSAKRLSRSRMRHARRTLRSEMRNEALVSRTCRPQPAPGRIDSV